MANTEYEVLELQSHVDSGTTWTLLETTTATSSDAAVRKIALVHGTGTYVAIPVRSFQPRTVQIEQRVVLMEEPS